MKVLVTGGAGFIGSNLVDDLANNPRIEEVRVIDDLSTSPRPGAAWRAHRFIEASILDENALREATNEIDAIVHLAALGSVPRSVKDPMASHEANATGTLRVLQAARRHQAYVVLASSSSVYGANARIPKTEDLQCLPMSPYAVSKLATEQYAMAFARCYDLPVLPFRFFNVYGPGQRAGHAYAAVVPAFLDCAFRGEPLQVNGDGKQSRDFTYVGSVTRTISNCLERRITGGPTNLAFGTRTDLLTLIGEIESILGRPVSREHRTPREGDVPHSQADTSALHQLIPDATPVSLREGLQKTIEWFSKSSGSSE